MRIKHQLRNSLSLRLFSALLLVAAFSASLSGAASLYLGFLVVRQDIQEALEHSANDLKTAAKVTTDSQSEILRWEQITREFAPDQVGKIIRVLDARRNVIYTNAPSSALRGVIQDLNSAPLNDVRFVEVGRREYVNWTTNYFLSDGQERILQLTLPMPRTREMVKKASQLALPILLLITLAAALASWWLGRRILKPLGNVAQHLGQLKNRDVNSWSLIPQQSQRELFGDVVEAVNDLINQMQESAIFRENWARSIAHEIRTPLMIVLGEVETFDFERASKKDVKAFTEQIRKDIMGIESIVKTILAIGKRSSTNQSAEDVDIREVLHDFLKEFEKAFQVKIISRTQGLEMPRAYFEWSFLRVMIDNILRNSVKHGSKRAPLILVDVRGSSNALHIRIEDDGPGLSQEQMAALKRWKHWESALGVGLNLCKQIEALLSWKISFSRASSGGLCVEIDLPIQAARRQVA